MPLTGGGGGVRGKKKKVCEPKIDLQFRAPLINFIFLLRTNVSDVGGIGLGGQAEEPRLPFRPPSNAQPWPALGTQNKIRPAHVVPSQTAFCLETKRPTASKPQCVPARIVPTPNAVSQRGRTALGLSNHHPNRARGSSSDLPRAVHCCTLGPRGHRGGGGPAGGYKSRWERLRWRQLPFRRERAAVVGRMSPPPPPVQGSDSGGQPAPGPELEHCFWP